MKTTSNRTNRTNRTNNTKALKALIALAVLIVIALGIWFSSEKPKKQQSEQSETTSSTETTETTDIDKAIEDRGTFKVYTDDENNVTGYDQGYLAEMPADNYNQTDFQKEVANGYEYITAGEKYEDKLGIEGSDAKIAYKDVISMINKLYKEQNASTYRICEVPDNQESVADGLVYIVCLDYDYYIITYYDGEGVTAVHDDTAYYASIYSEDTEQKEDEEWEDDGYDGAVVEENIVSDDWAN